MSVSMHRREAKYAYGSSRWSVLCTTTRSAGARPGLGTYVAASRRAGCRQIPGQPCGLWKKEATKTSSIKKMSVPHTAGMLTAVQRLTRTGAAV